MMEQVGPRTDSQHSELDHGSPELVEANGTSRPSSKAIYNQRKDYALSMLKQQSNFQHRVEHLLTAHVDFKDICGMDDCVAQLKMMDAQGRVWGQDMILRVRDHELLLSDIETKEELESYPLEHIQECTAVLSCCAYNSILAIAVRGSSQSQSSIILFQCEQLGAELMKANLEKAVKEWKGKQMGEDLPRSNMAPMPGPPRQASFHDTPLWTTQDRRQSQEPQNLPASRDPPASRDFVSDQLQPRSTDPKPQRMQDVDRYTEILNHVLSDIELFVGKLKEASGSLMLRRKSRKKERGREALPPQPEFEACFQKNKYALNLLGKLKAVMQQPSAPELVVLIFSTLSLILDNCPWPMLASSVVSPLLTEAALDLLDEALEKKERAIWKSLGKAWNTTSADYPNGQLIPPYSPTFSDGWVPPLPARENANAMQQQPNGRQPRAPPGPPQLMQATYNFQARNPKELTVTKGEVLEILDPRRKWWLARNHAGQRGFIPNNIVGPVGQASTVNGTDQADPHP
ncbi:epidermal growth factor receptor kinase substrate 8-like protein 3 [Carettochelys insculpta]|uniref:epidermal growth factor receptor kinase substrate 8-like protein 3 n=1 Tax=Carettochelys insculpta TaxID=44489 RepID=UPI003EBD6FA9